MINKYLEKAKEYGYCLKEDQHYLETITSRPFIVAIVNYILKEKPFGGSERNYVNVVFDGYGKLMYNERCYLISDFASAQAKAIMNKRLNEFIKTILNIK